MSGRPIFTARQRAGLHDFTKNLDVERYTRFGDPQGLREGLDRIKRDLPSDPPGAIAGAKELVESVCKAILDEYDVSYRAGAELMYLL